MAVPTRLTRSIVWRLVALQSRNDSKTFRNVHKVVQCPRCVCGTDPAYITTRHFSSKPPLNSLNIAEEADGLMDNFDPQEAAESLRDIINKGHLRRRDIYLLVNSVVKRLLGDDRVPAALQLLTVLTQQQDHHDTETRDTMKNTNTSHFRRLHHLLSSCVDVDVAQMNRHTKDMKKPPTTATEKLNSFEVKSSGDISSFTQFLGQVDGDGHDISPLRVFRVFSLCSFLGCSEIARVCHTKLLGSSVFVPHRGVLFGMLLQAYINDNERNNTRYSDNYGQVLHSFLDEIIDANPTEISFNDEFMNDFGKEHLQSSKTSEDPLFNQESLNEFVLEMSPNDALLAKFGDSFIRNFNESDGTTEVKQFRHNFEEDVQRYIQGHNTAVADVNEQKVNNGTGVAPSSSSSPDGRKMCTVCGKSFKGDKGLKMHWSRSKTCKGQ